MLSTAGAGLIMVESFMEFDADPPPETTTWFVRVAGAVKATFTVTVMGG